MDIGYWKIVAEEEACERLKLLTLDGKRRWKGMYMGYLNAAPIFVSTTMKLQMEWYTLAKEHVLKFFASKIIVDDVLLYGYTDNNILDYLRTVMDVLKYHHAKLNLKK